MGDITRLPPIEGQALQPERLPTELPEKAFANKAYYATNDARAEKLVRDALHRMEKIAFSADTNCYLSGPEREANLQQSWQTALSKMAGSGLQFFIPTVWEEEIKKFLRKSIPQQLAFSPPRFNDRELTNAIEILQSLATKLKQNSSSIAEDLWAKHKAETQAKIIEPKGESLCRVLDLYARHGPPFSVKANKKHEFPDAFALIALEDFAKATQQMKIVVASEDIGCLDFCKDSKHLIGVSSASKALSFLSTKEEIERLLQLSISFSSANSGILDEIKHTLRSEALQNWHLTAALLHQWQQKIVGSFQPRVHLVDVESVNLIESGPHKLLFTVQSESDYAMDILGKAEITAAISCYVNAYDSETQVGGTLPLFLNEVRTFAVDYSVHRTKQGSPSEPSSPWWLHGFSSDTIVNLPLPPEHWEPRPMA